MTRRTAIITGITSAVGLLIPATSVADPSKPFERLNRFNRWTRCRMEDIKQGDVYKFEGRMFGADTDYFPQTASSPAHICSTEII